MKKTVFILLLVILGVTANAQISKYNQALKLYEEKNFELAEQYMESVCNHIETKNNPIVWASAALMYANICNESPSVDSLLLQKTVYSLQKWEQLKQPDSYYDENTLKNVKGIYNYVANYYATKATELDMSRNRETKESEFVEIFQLYEKSIQHYSKSKNDHDLSVILCWMGRLYQALGSRAYIGDIGYEKYADFVKYKNNWFINMENCFDNAEKYNKSVWSDLDFSNREDYYKQTGENFYDFCVKLFNEKEFIRCIGNLKAAEKMFLFAKDKEGVSKVRELIEKCQRENVDEYIPLNNINNPNTYAFIIANEDYPGRHVPFALNDGRIFMKYCKNVLGVSDKHLFIYENATGNNIVDCIESIKDAAIANSGDINVIFYYAGHAFPDEETKEAYLMPVDGNSARTRTCYSLKELYKELGTIKAKSVVCFLDACFSGATREDQMLIAGRGVAIKPKEETPQGNLIVFTSASGTETAHQYESQHHGLFTYYLLKKIQEAKDSTTLGDLYDYLSVNVKRTSFDINKKIQTPTVIPSATMSTKWRNIKL